MKFFSIILLSLLINFSSFAFLPAENTSTTEPTKAEPKENTTKISSAKLLEKLESNKAKLSLKERLATKLLKRKLKKLEKRESKNIESTKDGTSLAAIFRVVGIVLIILGIVGLITSYTVVGAGIGAIILGLILVILPSII